MLVILFHTVVFKLSKQIDLLCVNIIPYMLIHLSFNLTMHEFDCLVRLSVEVIMAAATKVIPTQGVGDTGCFHYDLVWNVPASPYRILVQVGVNSIPYIIC